jgi:hypothetical protein
MVTVAAWLDALGVREEGEVMQARQRRKHGSAAGKGVCTRQWFCDRSRRVRQHATLLLVMMLLPGIYTYAPAVAAEAVLPGAWMEAAWTEAQFLGYLHTLVPPVPALPRAATFGVTSGFGMPAGWVYLAGAATDKRERRTDGTRDWDGSAAAGAGFGDARTAVGIEWNLGITSTTLREFADSGNLNLRLHREVPGWHAGSVSSIALGLGNLLRWGDSAREKRNLTLSHSTLTQLEGRSGPSVPVLLTVGYGTAIRNLERDPAGFAGVGVGLHPALSVGLSWVGDEWMGGITVFPPVRKVDVQLTLGVGDLTERLPARRYLLVTSVVFRDVF